MTELRRQDAMLSCREGADALLPPLARGRLLISPFAIVLLLLLHNMERSKVSSDVHQLRRLPHPLK
jgi:hypothetical protein